MTFYGGSGVKVFCEIHKQMFHTQIVTGLRDHSKLRRLSGIADIPAA